MPDKPLPQEPPLHWEHYALWKNILLTLERIPEFFTSTISVNGINVTELYAFGAVLGLTIEQEVVRTLNNLRDVWDQEQHYRNYKFVRQPQTFPDVLFTDAARNIIMGIELKSWYLLAKEGEPSFRFVVSSKACAAQDLMVVVPWAFSNVLSGNPVIFKPFIAPACYVAEYRNYWWQHLRRAAKSPEIISPVVNAYYPVGRDEISDKPLEDKGKNFGRIARMGIMDEYVREFKSLDLLGIEVSAWRRFFKEQLVEEDDVM